MQAALLKRDILTGTSADPHVLRLLPPYTLDASHVGTLATALALVPMAVLGDVAGLEIVRPMAAVILGGLVTSTLVSLFIVPAACLRAGPSPEPDPAGQLVERPGLSPT